MNSPSSSQSVTTAMATAGSLRKVVIPDAAIVRTIVTPDAATAATIRGPWIPARCRWRGGRNDSRVQDFSNPPIHHALPVRPRIVRIDREDLRAFQHLRETRFDRHVGMCRNKVDLVLGEQALHRGGGGPV